MFIGTHCTSTSYKVVTLGSFFNYTNMQVISKTIDNRAVLAVSSLRINFINFKHVPSKKIFTFPIDSACDKNKKIVFTRQFLTFSKYYSESRLKWALAFTYIKFPL